MVKAHPTFICIVFAGLLYFASSGVLSAQNATLDGSDSRLSYLPPIVEPEYAVIPPATYQPILEPPIISAPIEDPIMAVASANSIQSSIQKSIPASFYDNHLARGNDPVDQLYRENAQRPLGGLFAKGFTRTMTLLGGWNFANSIDIADPTIAAGVPAAEKTGRLDASGKCSRVSWWLCKAKPSCLMLFKHELRRAASRAA